MIVVCVETSDTICWSLNAVPLPCFAEYGWGGCNGHAKRDRGPQWQFKFSNPFACQLNVLTPHSATQWGWGESLVVNAVPLVSVLQTRSSWMFVFKSNSVSCLKLLAVHLLLYTLLQKFYLLYWLRLYQTYYIPIHSKSVLVLRIGRIR